MHRNGHIGLTFLLLSLIALPFGLGQENIIVIAIIIAAFLSSLPDIDLKMGMVHHRGITHTLLFAILTGGGLGILFGYFSGITWGIVGFFQVFQP